MISYLEMENLDKKRFTVQDKVSGSEWMWFVEE